MSATGATLASRLASRDRRRWRPGARGAVDGWPWLVLWLEVAAAVWVAALPWLGAYRTGGVVWLLLAAALAAPAVSLLSVVALRRGAAVSYPASAVALVALLVAGVSSDPAQLARGLVSGPSHLLTDTLPLVTPRWIVVPAVVVTWVAGGVAGEVAARSRRVGPVLAVVAASFLAAYAGASGAPHQGPWEGALVLAAGGLLAVTFGEVARRERSRRGGAGGPSPVSAGGLSASGDLAPADGPAPDGRGGPDGGSPPAGPPPGGPDEWWRRLLGGAAFAAALAAVTWAVIPQLPGMGGHGGTLRRPPPVVAPIATSPVDVMASLRDDNPTAPPVSLLRVQVSRPFDGYLPVAVLDNYDGDLWSFDRTFQPTGGRVPPPPRSEPQPAGPRLTASIDLLRPLAPSLPLIPYPERPLRVSGITVDEDPSTGMVVPASGLSFPANYQVEARSPVVTLEAVPPRAPLDLGAGVADLQLTAATASDLTSTLRYLAAATGQRPAPDVAFLKALASTLQRDDRRVDPLLAAASGAPPSRGGTSLAEVVSAITVSQEATPEQFATLFAVVARDLGVPARLVTGFRLAPDGRPVGPGAYTVTNRQAWTWVEVPVAGLGWVVADPTPALTSAANRPPPVAAASTPPTTAAPQANAVPSNAPGTHALAPPPRFPRAKGEPLPLAVLVLLAAVGGLVALVALVLGWAAGRRALRRRSRRRRDDPRILAVGAWLDLLDGLERAGLRPPPWATASEVGQAAAATFGPDVGDPVTRVGALAERAVCSRNATVEPHAALGAWDTGRQVTRTVASRLGRGQRWRARVGVGSHPRRPLVRCERPSTGEEPPAAALVGSASS